MRLAAAVATAAANDIGMDGCDDGWNTIDIKIPRKMFKYECVLYAV